jgi:serine/threonine protein kinase
MLSFQLLSCILTLLPATKIESPSDSTLTIKEQDLKTAIEKTIEESISISPISSKQIIESDVGSKEGKNPEPNQLNCNIKDFKIYEELGKGAFGTVYRAQYKNGNKSHVIKILNQDKLNIESVKREFNVLERLDSPFIAKFYCMTACGDRIAQVFDYIQGEDLFSYLASLGLLRSKRPLKEENVKIIAWELIHALKYLQERGIAWGDLKMENIIIDIRGHLNLIDFGLAEFFDASTQLGGGTTDYIAPEILKYHYNDTFVNSSLPKQSSPSKESIDWFSAGHLIYQLFYGSSDAVSNLVDNEKSPLWEKVSKALKENHRCLLSTTNEGCREDISKEAIEVMNQLLMIDPKKRLEHVKNIENHPWFKDMEKIDLNKKSKLSPLPQISRMVTSKKRYCCKGIARGSLSKLLESLDEKAESSTETK